MDLSSQYCSFTLAMRLKSLMSSIVLSEMPNLELDSEEGLKGIFKADLAVGT